MQTTSHVSCRLCVGADVFYAIDGIYQSSFGESSVPTPTQLAWLLTQPNGMIGLFDEDKVIGGISFWALKSNVFHQLSAGKLRERNIKTTDLMYGNYIYISDIAINPDNHGNGYATLLFEHCFRHIANNEKVKYPLHLLAFGYSEGGKALLGRFGFVTAMQAHETLEQQAILMLTVESKDKLLQSCKNNA